ncbi:hypothetical protein [Sphingobacterium siyangense]|uniref:hypothetical protein n=1 Tax=Sphingobacterium siyangense TaxID=459529 RepID=UPI00191B244F|nr:MULTISPECIES: hypothetical protein [Sphingobacterium]QQT31540.1 hypothetical protein I6I99_02930 [Sphingobacterium multivorum]QRY57638.1 hypothetical protein JVX97_27270 [Sphingobacterium siyangense]
MKKKSNQHLTKLCKRKCDEIEILIFYSMLLQRVSLGLSPQEVSFLMGKPLDFMSKIESFKIKTILAIDYYIFCRVLNVSSTNSIMLPGMDINLQKHTYELEVTTLNDRVVYLLSRLDVEEGQRIIEFKLIDARHDIDPYEDATKLTVEKINNLITAEINEGYFSVDRSPSEIHKRCCEKLDKYIQPKNLMKILEDLLNRSDELKLIRKESKYGFVYLSKSYAG